MSNIKNNNLNWFNDFFCVSKKMVIAYLISTAVYLLYNESFLDFNEYLHYVKGFNITGPSYFVLLYLQLMIISRWLCRIIVGIPKKKEWIGEKLMGVLIIWICYLTTNFTNMLDVYGETVRKLTV